MNLATFIDNTKELAQKLIIYDYIGFGVAFVVFIFFFILALFFRKNIVLFFLILIISLLVPLLSPFAIKEVMNRFVKSSTLEIVSNSRLKYDDVVVIDGVVTNNSIIDFRGCIVEVSFKDSNLSLIDRYIAPPFLVKKESIESTLDRGSSTKFRIIIENFKRRDGYESSFNVECW